MALTLVQVAHKEWKRAEADLSLALSLDGENAAVLKLQKQLPKLKERQFRDNKKLSKEMSKWLVSARAPMRFETRLSILELLKMIARRKLAERCLCMAG